MHESPIDPDVTELLSPDPAAAARVPAAELSAEELRRGMRETIADFTRGAEPIVVHLVSDELAPGSGGQIPVRVYSPENPVAVIVYMHGGAWMMGDIETHDLVTRRLSRDTGAVVVSVDYRMLPEHPFPAPFDDAWDATVWASALHPDLPLVVAGDSAGGTLAACIALRARDEGGLRVDAQVLVYPGIDDDLGTPSMLAFGDGHIPLEDLRFYFEQYAANEAALASPYALPGRATSLTGLPPAIVVIAGHDPLRSAEEDYARRLDEAGVPVSVQLDPELVHGWIDFAPRVPAADRAFSRLVEEVTKLISRVAA